jgi:hypothetical protein
MAVSLGAWSTILRSVVCGRCFGRVEGLARSGSHRREEPCAALPGRRSITVAESVTKRRSEVTEVKADFSPKHQARVSQSRNRGIEESRTWSTIKTSILPLLEMIHRLERCNASTRKAESLDTFNVRTSSCYAIAETLKS